jgi:hypothetical protein
MRRVLIGTLLGDVVADVEPQRHPAMQVDLEAAAEVQSRIVVVARRIARDAHAAAADQHERVHAAGGDLKQQMPAARPHDRAFAPLELRRAAHELALDAQKRERQIGDAHADLGRGLLEVGVRQPRIVQRVVAGHEDEATKQADLSQVAARSEAVLVIVVARHQRSARGAALRRHLRARAGLHLRAGVGRDTAGRQHDGAR